MSNIAPAVLELRRAFADGWPPTLRFIEWAGASETPLETNVADLAKRLRLNQPDAKGLVDGIVELELARFVVGRRGQQSRLQWQFTLKSIAAAARGEADALQPIGKNTLKNRSAAHNVIDHSYQLRRDFKAVIALPDDLRKEEAARLAAFIQTLPFED